jgi:hypothetical protein
MKGVVGMDIGTGRKTTAEGEEDHGDSREFTQAGQGGGHDANPSI